MAELQGRISLLLRKEKLPLLLFLGIAAALMLSCTDICAARPLEGRREALALLAQGQEALKAGRVTQAVELLSRSVEIAPSPAAYYLLGQALRKAGQKQKAREAFEKAIELNPNYELAKQALNEIGSKTPPSANSGAEATNFDAVVSEHETLDSLKPGDNEEVKDTKPTILAVGALLPKPKQLASASAAPIPNPPSTVRNGTARDAVIPQRPVEIIQEVPVREIVSAGVAPGKERGRSAMASDSSQENTSEGVKKFSLWRGKKEQPISAARHDTQSSRKSVSTPPSTRASSPPEVESNPMSALQRTAPDARAINEAAFSSDDQEAQKRAKRYGNPTKILLGTFEFHKEKGDTYRRAQRWTEAADEYQQALEKNPDDAETRAMLAECLARAGEVDVAEQQFRRALEMDPGDPRVFFRMGNTYRELKRLDDAISAYRRALAANPNDVVIRNNLGVVYMEKGQYTKAAQEFKSVIATNPKYDKAVLNLGILYDEHLGDKKQALQYYQMYVQLGGPRAREVQKWIEELQSK
ncbi:MAG: tetratricopeptide repeat protein [Candidatus Sumerlaeaceae bacterium]